MSSPGSVNADVSSAVAASAATTGPLRAYVHIKRSDSAQSAVLQTPGQALDVAEKTSPPSETPGTNTESLAVFTCLWPSRPDYLCS